MHIKDKIHFTYDDLVKYGPMNIVAFGDSVTHGAVAPGEINFETVYWNRLKKKIVNLRAYTPINVINAGIGGITAKNSIDRIDRDVLSHSPDLVIVCFGLNDVNGTLDDYLSSLKIIFNRCKSTERDTIFMTPNMLNTYVADDTAEMHLKYAAVTAEYQNSGRMDQYMQEACTLAADCGVTLCDCYSEWKSLSKTEDTTLLLANRINHPTKEMHELFAESLFKAVFGNQTDKLDSTESTMYRK